MFKWFHDFYSGFSTDIAFYTMKALQKISDPQRFLSFGLVWWDLKNRSDVGLACMD